jgi:hypothetical protein
VLGSFRELVVAATLTLGKQPLSAGMAEEFDKTPQRTRPRFSKAQGWSRHDEADMQDVARKAAKKSQRRNESIND